MTVNPHQSLIQAICNRDIATIEKFMDNEALHFQTEKDVAVKYLGEFFEMIASFMVNNPLHHLKHHVRHVQIFTAI